MPVPDRLGVVVGLAAEARLVRRLGLVGVGGGTPAGAEVAAERLVSEGAAALLSFGLAGGLDPALAVGARIVPGSLCHDGRDVAVDAGLLAWLGGANVARTTTAARIVATRAAKAVLARRTGAAAVDLESGAVATVALRHGLPFAILRAISDPAGDDLPAAALVALTAAGRPDLPRVLASLLREPRQLPALIRLALGSRRALLALRKEAVLF